MKTEWMLKRIPRKFINAYKRELLRELHEKILETFLEGFLKEFLEKFLYDFLYQFLYKYSGEIHEGNPSPIGKKANLNIYFYLR